MPLEAETHTGLASQGDAEGDQVLGEPQRPSCPRSGDGRQPLRKDTTATSAIAAKPLADTKLEPHAIRGPRQIGEGTEILAVDTPSWRGTQRAGNTGLRRAYLEGDLRRGGVNVARVEA